jgi:hypothetical protein
MLDHGIFQLVWGHCLGIGRAAMPFDFAQKSAQQANFISEAISHPNGSRDPTEGKGQRIAGLHGERKGMLVGKSDKTTGRPH